MNTISITLNKSEADKLCSALKNFTVPNPNPCIEKMYKYNNWTIILYKTRTLTIQGKDANSAYEKIFNRRYKEIDLDKQNIFNEYSKNDQFDHNIMGSDEVGVGDFFGGLVACAAYVRPDQIEWLKKIGIRDSKTLDDSDIEHLYHLIESEIKYSCSVLKPIAYNKMYCEFPNSHILKAYLHNRCFKILFNKISKEEIKNLLVVIDQFASRENYEKYIDELNEEMFPIDIFATQAESKYLAVACASIIARKAFLSGISALEEEFNLNKLPLGAGNPRIPEIVRSIVHKHGEDALKYLCKMHFKTFDQIAKGEK